MHAMNPVKVTVHPKNEGEKKEAVFVHITTVIGVQKNIGTLSTFMDQKKEKKNFLEKSCSTEERNTSFGMT